MFTADAFLQRLLMLPLWILSLSVREYAHAWTARRLGDDTAEKAGRLTLSPLSHIDLLGTIIIPLLGVPFGWAKPAPVDPSRFRRDVNVSSGMARFYLAGLGAGVAFAVLAAVGLGLGLRFAPEHFGGRSTGTVFLYGLLSMNAALTLINLIPLPPMDAGNAIGTQIPFQWRDTWEQVRMFSPFAIMALFLLGGRFLAGPIDFMVNLFLLLTQAIA